MPPLPPGPPPSAIFSGGPSEGVRQHLADFGYVIVTDAVNPSMMGELLAAGRRVAPRVRSGELNNRMLTPLDGEPIFVEYYACPELLRYVLDIIRRPIEELSLAEFCVFSQAADGPGANGGWCAPALPGAAGAAARSVHTAPPSSSPPPTPATSPHRTVRSPTNHPNAR